MTAAGRTVDILLVVAIGGVLLSPVMFRVVRRRFDPFEPIVLFAVAYGVMFVVRPTAMIARNSLVYAGPRRTLDVSATFTEMLLLALLGAIAFVIGYFLPLGARFARLHRAPRRHVDVRRLTAGCLLVGLAGFVAYTLAVASDGGVRLLTAIFRSGTTALPSVSGGEQYGTFLFLIVVPAALILLALGLELRDAKLLIASLCFAALILIPAFPLGSRITLLPFIGGIFVLYYVRRSARPSFRTILIVAVVAFVASTFLSDLRGRATRHQSVATTVVRATSPSRLASAITDGPDSEMAPVLAAALSVIPSQMHYTYGTTIFGDLATRAIPRALWSGKPLIPRHRLIARIWPVESARGTINVEFSALLYFYWDFSFFGVIAGLTVYGVLARYLYSYFLLHQQRTYAQVLYSLSLWFVVIGLRDSPVDTFVRGVFVLAPVWGIFLLSRLPAFVRSKPSVAQGPTTQS
jgi:hypothetical protein